MNRRYIPNDRVDSLKIIEDVNGAERRAPGRKFGLVAVMITRSLSAIGRTISYRVVKAGPRGVYVPTVSNPGDQGAVPLAAVLIFLKSQHQLINEFTENETRNNAPLQFMESPPKTFQTPEKPKKSPP